MSIVAKINVNKIAKEHLFQGKTAKYLDVVFHDNRNGKDEYGYDGFITQSVSKEAKAKGEKGPIIGNWKKMDWGKRNAEPKKTEDAKPESDTDEPPF